MGLNLKENIAGLPFLSYLKIAFAIDLLTALIPFLAFKFLPPQVPLFYGMAVGEEQLSSVPGLIIPPLASLTIITVNTAIATTTSNDFLKKILVVSAIATSFFSTITVIKIILLVGSF